MSNKRRNKTDWLNNQTYLTIFNKFKLVALNAFKWDGLPSWIDEKFIERELFNNGCCIFCKDPEMSFMALPTFPGSRLNVYGEPLTWRAVGLNYQKEYNTDDCVIIGNNKLRQPTKPFIDFYTLKLYEAERTLDVNIKACKTPFIFACDDKDVFTFKQIFNRIDGNEPVIYADRGLTQDSLQVLQTGITFMGNDLQDYKNTVENELLTFLGKNNVAVDKKERLITDEAEANDELIQSFSDIQLEAREKACEEINKLYGLNVSVKRRCQPVEKPVNKVDKTEV